MKRQLYLYFIVIGAFLLFISGNFLSEGLSRAGMDNAVVSQRMAEGFEGFWMPSLSSPGNPDRMNYLPLGYWIESKWFALFGNNSFMAEKVYSVMTYFIIAALMIWIWTLIGHSRHTGWLPLLCWITIPIVSWSATNNLLESTMTMFIMLSVAFLLKAGKASFIAQSRLALGKKTGPYKLSRTAWIVFAAFAMEFAFMVKGFAGLFPIFFPILYWLMVRRERILFPIYTTGVILMVWMATFFLAIIISPEVYNHLYNYLHHQMIGGVLHVQTVASRFYILYVLFVQGIIPLLIMIVMCVIRIKNRPFYRFMFFWRHSKKLTAVQIERAKLGWFFLAVGFSGILPIMMGLKQQEFYIVPTLPFFAIAMACLLYDLLEDWLERMNKTAERVLTGLAALLFGSGLLLNLNSIHKVNSNQDLLSDMRLILPYLDYNETIMVSDEVMEAPEVAEYFYRYKKIAFDTNETHTHLLTIYDGAGKMSKYSQYELTDLPTQMYHLFERVEKNAIYDTITEQTEIIDTIGNEQTMDIVTY
ncbi:MAG: phospholipid carrier-dependent glycosyltransferase [Bacteroidales bacterium]|nr:phospholipid carrier-dependent glycosyltransferase [Bacteroidales bacterium]